MNKAFYTTGEAAQALGVTSARVRQMILDGAMAAEKHGRDLLILPEAIEQARQRKTKRGPAVATATSTQIEAKQETKAGKNARLAKKPQKGSG